MHALFYAHMKPAKMLYSGNDHWEGGLFTNGHNSISSRSKYFNNPVKPYRGTDKCLEDIVPPEIAARIKAMGINQGT